MREIPMRFANGMRRLIAPILAIGLLAAAFVVVCPPRVHTAMASPTERGCAVAKHLGGLAPAIEAESASVVAPLAVEAIQGSHGAPGLAARAIVRIRATATRPGSRMDVLDGHLRV
jgi:hypothetical protein